MGRRPLRMKYEYKDLLRGRVAQNGKAPVANEIWGYVECEMAG
jgi:hypothetical protein